MRVLIVEDEKIKRITMTDALLMEGYDVVAVENPIEALNVFKTKEFDVVITDIRLPHMSGLDFLREIKSLKPDTTVIVTSPYEWFGFLKGDKILKAGYHCYCDDSICYGRFSHKGDETWRV